jgi:hypothetical protein
VKMHILALYVIIASLLSPCIAYVFYVVYVPALPALHNSVAIATIQHQENYLKTGWGKATHKLLSISSDVTPRLRC